MTVECLFYSTKDIAALNGLSVATVRTKWRKLLAAGRIPAPFRTSPLQWRRDATDRFYAEQGAAALIAAPDHDPARGNRPGRPPTPKTPQPRGTLVALMRARA